MEQKGTFLYTFINFNGFAFYSCKNHGEKLMSWKWMFRNHDFMKLLNYSDFSFLRESFKVLTGFWRFYGDLLNIKRKSRKWYFKIIIMLVSFCELSIILFCGILKTDINFNKKSNSVIFSLCSSKFMET